MSAARETAEKTAANEPSRPRPLRALLRLLIWFLIGLVFLALILTVIPLTENGDTTAVAGSADWMSVLDDALPLNELTIPGTHDSGTEHVSLAFFSKCQGMDVGRQLEAGYRYLDVRLAVSGNRMKLMHGFTGCLTGDLPWSGALTLDAVLSDCYAFLDAHPGETVLFAVKQEHGNESVEEFQWALDRYVRAEPDRWLRTETMPTLGEARGKLVLLRRYPDEAGLGAAAGLPLLWRDQQGHEDASLDAEVTDEGAYLLRVQDRFEYGEADKWAAFLRGLEQEDEGRPEIRLSFLSTKGPFPYGHPWRYANALNARLANASELPLRGWIVVDYGSAPLAQQIYSTNFS